MTVYGIVLYHDNFDRGGGLLIPFFVGNLRTVTSVALAKPSTHSRYPMRYKSETDPVPSASAVY